MAAGPGRTYLQVHVRLTDAKALLERALAIDEAAYGPDHPDVATNLNNLATILQDLWQPAAARPLQERALAISEAAYGSDHPDVARDLNNLATILRDLGSRRRPGRCRNAPWPSTRLRRPPGPGGLARRQANDGVPGRGADVLARAQRTGPSGSQER
jgi:hypothetical protein